MEIKKRAVHPGPASRSGLASSSSPVSSKRRVGLSATVLTALVGLLAVLGFSAPTAQALGDTPVDQIHNVNPGADKHFQVYYRAWRDVTMRGVNTDLPDENWISMYDIPYGVDVVNIFSYVPPGQEKQAQPFYDKLKNDYGPYLHKRGIRLVRGLGYDSMVEEFYDFLKERGVEAADAKAADYEAYADKLIADKVESIGVDGLDIDMETYPDADEVKVSDQIIRALAKRLGPLSNNPDNTMLLYDTNTAFPGPLENVADAFNYIAFQQYGYDATTTRNVIDAFAKIVPASKIVPGLTFPEEQDPVNRWLDTVEPYESSHINSVSTYVNENDLGGMFLYAFDRDGRTYDEHDWNHIIPSNLLWTKTAIAQSQGMTLQQAKAAAKHFLKRSEGDKPVPANVRSDVDKASNLYEVFKAVLGGSDNDGYSSKFDPTYERLLMANEQAQPTDPAPEPSSPETTTPPGNETTDPGAGTTPGAESTPGTSTKPGTQSEHSTSKARQGKSVPAKKTTKVKKLARTGSSIGLLATLSFGVLAVGAAATAMRRRHQ